MQDHTYAGYTAAQIRAAAEAAEHVAPGPWSTDLSSAPVVHIETAAGFGIAGTLTPEVAPHIATSCPSTVLALLDRIAELEQQQRQMADDVTVIQRIHGEQKAALYRKLAELEQRAARAQSAG